MWACGNDGDNDAAKGRKDTKRRKYNTDKEMSRSLGAT